MIYCGVDGGGTKTKIIIANDDDVLMTVTTGPTAIDTVSLETTKENIRLGLEEIYNKLDIPKIDSIFLGIGGIATKKDIEMVNSTINELPYFKDNSIINSDNDIKNAYLASCSGRPNITVIIGTGAVAYGRDEEGNEYRTNGIHYLEGDFGGAYDLGVRALKKMTQAYDGRIEHTDFTKYLLKHLNITDIKSLTIFLEKFRMDRTYIAQLSQIVTKYVSKDDKYASEILAETVDEMILSIQGVYNHIHLTNLEVGVVGSLGNSKEYFNLLKNKLQNILPKLIIHSSELDPVYGSLIESKEQRK